MQPYDDLIKTMRHCVATMKCTTCPVDSIDKTAKAQQRCVTLMLAKAADAIEELSKPRWIPVTERLPKYGERVLVFGKVTMYVAYYDKNQYGGENWHKLNSKSHYCNPTHWMPLPQPPKEETK